MVVVGGPLAQQSEQPAHNRLVVGANPTGPTNCNLIKKGNYNMLIAMLVLSIVFLAFILLLLFAFFMDDSNIGGFSFVCMAVSGFVNSVMGIVYFALNS